jgi:hypothetical protein
MRGGPRASDGPGGYSEHRADHGGFTLGAVALTFGGNILTDWRRNSRASKAARDAAIAEVLAAAIDLMQAVNVIRSNWKHQTNWRARLLIVAALMRDIPDVHSWKDLADRALMRKLLCTARGLAHKQDEAALTFTLDYATTVAPRASRFYAAVTALTLGGDRELAEAARKLAQAGAALLEAAEERDGKLASARGRFEKQLAAFRAVADQRRR